jgi:hypothetical protein
VTLLGPLLFAAPVLFAQPPGADFLNHGRPILDAHNCYPYEGSWADRLDRALATGFPIAIEQDLAWSPNAMGTGRVVVTHDPHVTGAEPALRDYFFERVRPVIENALAGNDRTQWPLIILHLDFKSNEAPLLHAVWGLLGEYESWITTARKTPDATKLAPLDRKPLLVLTEDSDAQEEIFFHRVPVGGKLRLFGSAHTAKLPGNTAQERAHYAATLDPRKLLTERPTNYRRWWNNSWFEVEEGGQTKAGDWTMRDAKRLRALVNHAHRLGFVIRFYLLDGFRAAENKGWDQGYNFGSRSAVHPRWKAAIEAAVDLIGTDQYEDFAAFLASENR